MTLRRLVATAIAVLLPAAASASACPLCNPTGTTFANEVAQADFILYGTLSNARPDPKEPEAFNKGTTDLAIDVVIKSHDMVKGKKSITIPRYVLPTGKNTKYLIFFNITNGQLDPYRGEEVPADSNLPKYLQGAIRGPPEGHHHAACATSSTTSRTRTSSSARTLTTSSPSPTTRK